MKYAKVIIDISADAIDRAFVYRIPEELEASVRPGVRVLVPFGNGDRKRKAYVIGVSGTAAFEEDRIKDLAGIDSRATTATGELISVAGFMASEFGCTMNQALKTVLPVKKSVRKNSRRTDPVERMGEEECFPAADEEMSSLQKAVTEELLTETERPSLLYGITGSGKTRVYIEIIRRMQALGRQTIVLIPEISLTYQTVNELAAHLGNRVAVLHSRLSEGERYEQYGKCAGGSIDVMVGPRSAVFAPFEHLGCIIIDEEHDKAYQSDTSPRYDVRLVAEYRCRLSGAKLILGSATPSLESYKKAKDGEYALSVMKERAVRGAALPEIVIADMRKELEEGNRSVFSRALYAGITECLAKKEQAMLFLNRRGYAGFVSCRNCGYVVRCPHCDVSMTAHNSWYFDSRRGEKAALLSCHYCGYKAPMPGSCPSCGSKLIAPFGTGTQKLELEVKRNFPAARVLRMDADTTNVKDGHETILSEFRRGNADILIGTQMIVKGHDFSNVTLVGIVAADQSINVPEYNASERTFQLLTQAAGRAGRGSKQGRVVIQSYEPEHYAIRMAAEGSYEPFFERELSFRKLMSYPPETALLSVRVMSEEEALAGEAAEQLARVCTETGKYEGVVVIGPCSDGVSKVKDIYRKMLYLKHLDRKKLLEMRDRICDCVRSGYSSRKIYLSFEIR